MIVIDHTMYSPGFLKKAVELAIAGGLKDDAPGAGEQSSVKDGLSVKTPMGEMTGLCSYENDVYPGITIDLMPGDNIITLATCEVYIEEKQLKTHVYRNTGDEEPTHVHEHYGRELEDAKC